MKKLIALILTLLLTIGGSALAESIIIITDNSTNMEFNQRMEIAETIEIEVAEPQFTSIWPGMEYSNRSKYLIVPVTVMNVSLDDINMQEAVQGKVTYQDKYEFAPEQYTFHDGTESLDITGDWHMYEIYPQRGDPHDFIVSMYGIDENGNVSMRWSTMNTSSPYNAENHEIAFNSGSEAQSLFILPELGLFAAGGGVKDYRGIAIKNDFVITEDASFELGMLAEDTMHIVFQIPNLVAEATEGRKLVLTIGGEEYSFEF